MVLNVTCGDSVERHIIRGDDDDNIEYDDTSNEIEDDDESNDDNDNDSYMYKYTASRFLLLLVHNVSTKLHISDFSLSRTQY